MVRKVFEKTMTEITQTICNAELPTGHVVRGRSAVGQNSVSPSDEGYFAPVYSEYANNCANALKKLEAEKKAVLQSGYYHVRSYPVGASVQVCTEKMDRCGFEKPTLSEAVESLKTEGYNPKGK